MTWMPLEQSSITICSTRVVIAVFRADDALPKMRSTILSRSTSRSSSGMYRWFAAVRAGIVYEKPSPRITDATACRQIASISAITSCRSITRTSFVTPVTPTSSSVRFSVADDDGIAARSRLTGAITLSLSGGGADDDEAPAGVRASAAWYEGGGWGELRGPGAARRRARPRDLRRRGRRCDSAISACGLASRVLERPWG